MEESASKEVDESRRDDEEIRFIADVLRNEYWTYDDFDKMPESENAYWCVRFLDNTIMCIDCGDSFSVIRTKLDAMWTVLYAQYPDKTMRCFVGEGDDKREVPLDKTVRTIDLDAAGRRWEGGVTDLKPCGYGVLFDEEGRKEYEGFMLHGLQTCYGVEYYSDIIQMKYVGCYADGNRCGKGTLYDRKGVIDYEGMWVDGHPASSHFDGNVLDSCVESIELFSDPRKGMTSFLLSRFLCSLKRIVIGNDCFEGVRWVEMTGLNELESVDIGEKSFTFSKNSHTVRCSKLSNGACRIVDCPKLKSIRIGDFSFADYHSIQLKNLPSLQSIQLGESCLYYVSSFSLCDLPQLQRVSLGDYAVALCHSVVFENLPELESVDLQTGAFYGDMKEDRKALADAPYNFKNTLVMRNLPSLSVLKGFAFNFHAIGSVHLENIPNLSFSGIQMSGETMKACFLYTFSVHSSRIRLHCSSFLDADTLRDFICFNAVSTGSVVQNPVEVPSIPRDVKDLWIQSLDASTDLDRLKALETLVLGNACGSMNKGMKVELSGFSSLRSIEMGKWCFFHASSFSLTDLPSLRTVTLGGFALEKCQTVLFENLPQLQSIRLAEMALECSNDSPDSDDDETNRSTLTIKRASSGMLIDEIFPL